MRALLYIGLAHLLLTASGAGLSAQRVERPRAGERVRISGGAHPGEFTLTGWQADTLLVLDTLEEETLRVPLASVDRLSVRRPRTPAEEALRGGIAGLFFFGGSGALMGLTAGDDGPDCTLCLTAGEKALLYGGAAGSVGLLLGGIVGALNPGERWQRVPTRTHVTVAPQPGARIGVAFSLRI